MATLCSSEEVSSQADGTLRRTQKIFFSPLIFSSKNSFVPLNKVKYASLHVSHQSPAQNALSPLDLLLQGCPHRQIVRRALPLPLCHLARHLQLCATCTHSPASFIVTCSPLCPCALHVFFWWQQKKGFSITRLLVRNTTAMGAAELGEVEEEGHWDSLPQSLTCRRGDWSISRRTPADGHAASSPGVACDKQTLRTSEQHRHLFPPPPFKYERLTRCLVDCCHYVSNWWIINQNTRAGCRGLRL